MVPITVTTGNGEAGRHRRNFGAERATFRTADSAPKGCDYSLFIRDDACCLIQGCFVLDNPTRKTSKTAQLGSKKVLFIQKLFLQETALTLQRTCALQLHLPRRC